MPATALVNIVKQFLGDPQPGLALALVRHGRARRGRQGQAAHGGPEQRGMPEELLLAGLVAGLYVIARIGLTFAAVGH